MQAPLSLLNTYGIKTIRTKTQRLLVHKDPNPNSYYEKSEAQIIIPFLPRK